jgi:hypothetical protein
VTTLHGAALRSHGGRLQREVDARARACLLDLRGRLTLAGVRLPEGATLEEGVRAGVLVLLAERGAALVEGR